MASRLKAFFLQMPTLRELCTKFGLVEQSADREWTNIMAGFCLASVIEIAVLSAQINSELPPIFHWASFSFLLGLACFFVGKFTGSRFPLTAQVLERIGMLFAVTGFFIAVTIPSPFWLTVITWVIYVVSLVFVFLCTCYNVFEEPQV